MITDAERAEAAARFQAQLDVQPPPDEERIGRIAALFAAITLRKARDRARASSRAGSELPESDTSGGFADDHADVRSTGDNGPVETMWRPCGDQVKTLGREPDDTSTERPPGRVAR